MDSLPVDLTWTEWLLFAVAGVVTGTINTLAGSGSLITLPIFIFIGNLSAPVANGTNRIGALLQSFVGINAFRRRGQMPGIVVAWLVVPAILGGAVGAWLASGLDKSQMNNTIAGLMIFMLLVLLINPKRWIRETEPDPQKIKHPLTLAAFFLIGIYGGFIQAGVGIFLLAGLVLVAGFELKKANAIKLLIVFFFNIPALIIFFVNHQVSLGMGLAMAIFQSIGTLIGVWFASKVPKANVYIHRLLVIIVIISAGKFLGLWDYLFA